MAEFVYWSVWAKLCCGHKELRSQSLATTKISFLFVVHDHGLAVALCHIALVSGPRLMRELLSGTLLVVEEEERENMVKPRTVS